MRLPSPSEYRYLSLDDKRLVLDQVELIKRAYLESEREPEPDRTPIPYQPKRVLTANGPW